MTNDGEKLCRKIVEIGHKASDRALTRVIDSLSFDLCESPIEQLMLCALAANTQWCASGTCLLLNKIEQIPDYYAKRDDLEKHTLLANQVVVGKYRADFCVAVSRVKAAPMIAIVECDGHDFHEKTKHQAARDKARDRFMQTSGYPVLRFSGSEIWRDASSCALQVIDFLDKAYQSSLSDHSDRVKEKLIENGWHPERFE